MSNRNQFDEEYQFPNDEFVDEGLHTEAQDKPEEIQAEPLLEDEAASQPSKLAEIWSQHKRTIIIVGVLAVVTGVFAIMRTTHKPVAEPAPVQPAVVSAPAPAPVAQMDPQIIEQLSALKQDAINNGATIRQLQNQVQQMTAVLSQARASQQQLNQSMIALAGQVQQLTAEMKTLSQPKVAKVEKPKADPTPIVTFQLRAVVPGRAWIVGSDGQSHSVAIGDQLPHYGTVQSINAEEGIVITTSGKTIRF